MYHSQLGRFCSRDPVGYFAGSFGLHEYVGSRPFRFLDPIGLDEIPVGPGGDGPWPYVDWLKWWQGKYRWGDLGTIQSGCIGVAATVCGSKDMEEFKSKLDHCYFSISAAEKAAAEFDCDDCPFHEARIVAIQFNRFRHSISGDPVDEGPRLRQLKEPFAINDIWDIVNQGFEMRGNRPFPITGAFDVQITFGGCWLGANHGVSPKHPNMDVIRWPDTTEHIKAGDANGYDQHAWCAVCCKRTTPLEKKGSPEKKE